MRIYEINARAHFQNFDRLTDAELAELARLGFEAVWLMGVWQISKGARRISKIVSEDFEGSPYAIPDYKISSALGGKEAFAALLKRARRAGLAVVVDFVSNHMALDSRWIKENPEFFIRSNPRVRRQSTEQFFLHKSGEVIAFGRDPYYPPWHDTAQLDYTNAALRTRMTKTLRRISQIADGVRCDMAMLVLRDQIRKMWFPLADDSWFDAAMPGEFWDQAIKEVKAARPNFKFIAEAYWDTEEYLCGLGFDLAYEKKLYDALVARDSRAVLERLSRSADALARSVYFIENHDEQRAAAAFSRPAHIASLALILSLPGSILIHEGQMEGRRERLPVQRLKPLTDEPVDQDLKETYARLLEVTRGEVFSGGSFELFATGVFGVVSFIRRAGDRAIAYAGQISDGSHKFNSAALDVTPLARAVGASKRVRLTDLTRSQSVVAQESGGRFLLRPSQIGADEETGFCLVEAATA